MFSTHSSSSSLPQSCFSSLWNSSSWASLSIACLYAKAHKSKNTQFLVLTKEFNFASKVGPASMAKWEIMVARMILGLASARHAPVMRLTPMSCEDSRLNEQPTERISCGIYLNFYLFSFKFHLIIFFLNLTCPNLFSLFGSLLLIWVLIIINFFPYCCYIGLTI